LTNKNGYPTLEIGDKILTERGYTTIIDLQVVDCEPVLVYSLNISGGVVYFAGTTATVVPTHSGGM
jgi:hypothetical protein